MIFWLVWLVAAHLCIGIVLEIALPHPLRINLKGGLRVLFRTATILFAPLFAYIATVLAALYAVLFFTVWAGRLASRKIAQALNKYVPQWTAEHSFWKLQKCSKCGASYLTWEVPAGSNRCPNCVW